MIHGCHLDEACAKIDALTKERPMKRADADRTWRISWNSKRKQYTPPSGAKGSQYGNGFIIWYMDLGDRATAEKMMQQIYEKGDVQAIRLYDSADRVIKRMGTEKFSWEDEKKADSEDREFIKQVGKWKISRNKKTRQYEIRGNNDTYVRGSLLEATEFAEQRPEGRADADFVYDKARAAMGQAAHKGGKPRSANPYKEGSDAALSWAKGYNEAQTEKRADAESKDPWRAGGYATYKPNGKVGKVIEISADGRRAVILWNDGKGRKEVDTSDLRKADEQRADAANDPKGTPTTPGKVTASEVAALKRRIQEWKAAGNSASVSKGEALLKEWEGRADAAEQKWLVNCICRIPVNLRTSTGFGNSDDLKKVRVTASSMQEAETKAIAYYKKAGYTKVTVTSANAEAVNKIDAALERLDSITADAAELTVRTTVGPFEIGEDANKKFWIRTKGGEPLPSGWRRDGPYTTQGQAVLNAERFREQLRKAGLK